jgi:hypothetical protein
MKQTKQNRNAHEIALQRALPRLQRMEALVQLKEKAVAPRDARHSSRLTGLRRIEKEPMKAAVMLLGIYVAVYLGVWLVLRVFNAVEMGSALAAPTSIAASAAAAATTLPVIGCDGPADEKMSEPVPVRMGSTYVSTY